jgi:phytoene dehydrogenase-like protein
MGGGLMPFTGDSIYGWRIAIDRNGRNTKDGTGRWVDEVVVELVKGQRHIRCEGQHGIDPKIVLGRAVKAAIEDDLREAQERQDGAEAVRIVTVLEQHKIWQDQYENGWAAREAHGAAIFIAGTASAGAGAKGN